MITKKFTLPDCWKVSSLSEIAESIQYGFTDSAKENKVGPKFLRITDIQNGNVDWNSVPYCEIKDKDIRKYLLTPGDILFARTGATTGKSFLIKNCPEAVFASYLIRIRLSKVVKPEFCYYYFQSSMYWSQIMIEKKGSAQPGVNATILSELKIPVPPIEEQTIIVSKIEELFSRLDAGVEGLKRAQTGLKRYRASVLKAAFEGRLLPQNPNDTPAQILLSSIGKEPLVKEDLTTLPTNWVWTTLGSITHPERNRVHPSDYPNSKYIGMADVESMTMKLLSTRLASEMKSTAESFKAGDVLYGSLRPYLNKVICPHFDGLCSTEFIVFPKTSHLNNDYLRIFLNTSEFVAYSTSLNTGDRPRVKFEQFKNYPFPLPPIDEQERIVNTLEKHISIIQIVEDKISENLIRTQTIKQAILNRAFEGKLIQKSKDQPTNLKDIDDNFENTKSQNISIQGSLF